MAGAVYFNSATRSQYRTAIGKIMQGEFVRSTHVDIHTQSGCNAACDGCVGNGSPAVEQRLNPDNIGFILDQIFAGGNNPYVHAAGLNTDPLAKSDHVEDRKTIPWATNTTVEGIVHLLKKGLADRVSLVTNGLGFYGKRDRGTGIPDWSVYDYIVYMPLIGSVQVNLNAFFDPKCSFEDLQSDKFNQVMENLRTIYYYRGWAKSKDDYYPAAYLAKLGIYDKLPIPLNIAGNFFLNPANYRSLPNLLRELRFNEKKTEFRFLDESLIAPDAVFTYPIDQLRLRVDFNYSGDTAFQTTVRRYVDRIIAEHEDEEIEIVFKSPDDPRELESLEGCLGGIFWPKVRQDGKVSICSHSYSSDFVIGSLFEKTLVEIQEEYFHSGRWRETFMCARNCPSFLAQINLLWKDVLGT